MDAISSRAPSWACRRNRRGRLPDDPTDLSRRDARQGSNRIESLRNVACNREACVLYQEIDIADEGSLAHRLLFWPNDEVTIEFSELECVCVPRNDCRVTLGGAFVVAEDDEARARATREQ